MIPAIWAAKLMPYKWLAIGLLLAAVTAWGGLGWYGKASAQRELAAYQLAASNVIVARLVENQRLADAQARKANEIAAAYLKGKQDVQKAFQPALADLEILRQLYAGGARPVAANPGRVLDGPEADPGAVPGPADPAGRTHAVACTDRPATLIESTHRVAQDLEACALDLARLKGLQQWVREVCQAR
jgi:hypothetical protein